MGEIQNVRGYPEIWVPRRLATWHLTNAVVGPPKKGMDSVWLHIVLPRVISKFHCRQNICGVKEQSRIVMCRAVAWTALQIFCDALHKQMGLPADRVCGACDGEFGGHLKNCVSCGKQTHELCGADVQHTFHSSVCVCLVCQCPLPDSVL